MAKFNKQREDLAAHGKLQRSVNAATTAASDLTHGKDGEEDELKVINTDASSKRHPKGSETCLGLILSCEPI